MWVLRFGVDPYSDDTANGSNRIPHAPGFEDFNRMKSPIALKPRGRNADADKGATVPELFPQTGKTGRTP